jgi:hypothetical protein
VAERINKAQKYYGGNNSIVVVIKVVTTHRSVICLGADWGFVSFMKFSRPIRRSAMFKCDDRD